MKKVSIYTDGGCEGNPGPGGWGVVLIYGKYQKELSGNSLSTTNNRMELTAAIEALRALKEPCQIDLFTDSKYLQNGILEWLKSWKKNKWRTANNKPVKNHDLWIDLDILQQKHFIQWKWVKGHSQNELNDRCDQLAALQIKIAKRKHNTPAE